jgi:hypothetical protein
MTRTRVCVVVGLIASALLACGSDKDTTAPPSPRIVPVDTPTALEKVTIIGSAEPGSSIVMSGAEQFDPAEITADPFSAEFRVVATLKQNATSTLSFIAKDKSGNASQPTTLVIEQEVGHGEPAALTVDLFVNGSAKAAADPITLAAGDTVHVVAQAQDKAGHVLDRAMAVSTSIPNAFVVGADVSSIQVAGKFAIGVVAVGSSLASSRAVTVAAGKPPQIVLDVTATEVTAGTPVHVAVVAKDAFGNVVPADAVSLSSSPKLAESYKPPCSDMTLKQGFVDAQRFVAYDLSASVEHNREFVLTATSGDVSGTATVRVLPAAAARFAARDPNNCALGEAFVFTDATWKNDLPTPINVTAGASVYYRYAVVDAYGNATTGPARVVTSAPSAQVIDDGVSGIGQVTHLTTAGTYDLSAYIAGVTAPAVRSFSVDVGTARSATVFTSTSLASPGDTVYAFATIKDGFGNVVSCPSGVVDAAVLELVASPATGANGAATTCSAGVFQRAFTFTGNGTYTLTTTYKPGTPVTASSFVTILGIDATPPSVSISNFRVNGTPCTPSGTPAACGVSRGDTIEFDLTANDNVALSELEYSAFFQTTGTLRTRTVLQASDAILPAVVHFTFNVPGGALPEDVALVGLAIDGSGNRATTSQLILRVGVFSTFGRTATVVASGGSINGPTDVAFNANGDMFIANDGNQNLLEIAHGSSAPFVFSMYNRQARYIAVDKLGNVYLTDATRISRVDATGMNVVNYVNLPSGATEGLAITAETAAKGTLDASSANDGATATIAGQTFELDSASDGCVGGRVCVTLGGGTKNAALAAAITAQSASVQASVDAGSGKIVLAAKTQGESGNALTLAASGMVVSAANLSQGHDQELFLAQTGDNNIYRLPETLTPTAVVGSNHGSFNVGATQRGVAIKDMSSVTGLAARDLYMYFVDSQNANTLRAYHAVDAASPTSVFALTNGAGQSFDTLSDLVLVPTLPVPASNPVNGCLLVSEQAQGRIYAVDTRNPSNAAPTVTLVASGLSEPRGLGFYAGDLYVADRALDAVIRVSASPDPNDCF